MLYVVDAFPTVSETFVIAEVRELLARGDDVTVYARRHGGAPPTHAGADRVAAHVRYRPRRGRRLAAAAHAALAAPRGTARALRWALLQRRHDRGMTEAFLDACVIRRRARDADRIHGHFAQWPAAVAILAERLTGTPCSFTAHAHDIYLEPPGGLARKVAAARRVVTVSEYTRAALRARVRATDGARIVVVRNGVEGVPPRAAADPPRALVLSVGRLVATKGMRTVVEACALSTAGADWLVLGDGPLRAELEARASERCGGRLRFAGAVEHDAVRAALAAATVFVLPCETSSAGDRDGLPVAIVEALAAGVAVVSTPVAGIPEVVRDGESGLLVAPRDPQALALAVDRLLADPGLRDALPSEGCASPRATTCRRASRRCGRPWRREAAAGGFRSALPPGSRRAPAGRPRRRVRPPCARLAGRAV